MLSRFSHFIERKLLRLVLHPAPCAKERLGSEYGGWWVVPSQIHKDDIVYSVGIGKDVSFDLELIRRFGVKVHAFDPTPDSIEWVRNTPHIPPKFILHEYGLDAQDGEVDFYPPANKSHVSHSIIAHKNADPHSIRVPMRRLSSVCRELGHARIDLLKMDIEGSEYRVIPDILQEDMYVGQFLVEFHHRFSWMGIIRTLHMVHKLRARGFLLFAISDSAEEYSFIHKSLL